MHISIVRHDTNVIEGNMTIKEWKEEYLRKSGLTRIEFTDYATFSYDAFWVYVKALQQLIQEGSVPFTVIILVNTY